MTVKQIVIGKGTIGTLIHEQTVDMPSTLISARDFVNHSYPDQFDLNDFSDSDLRIILASTPASKWKINSDSRFASEARFLAYRSLTASICRLCLPVIQNDRNVEIVLISSTDYRLDHSYGRLQRDVVESFLKFFDTESEFFGKEETDRITFRVMVLPALAGKGIKKNALYDLTHDNTLHEMLDLDTIDRMNSALETMVDDDVELYIRSISNVTDNVCNVEYYPSREAWLEKGLTPLLSKSMIELEDYFDVSRLVDAINEILKPQYSDIVRVATIFAVSLDEVFESVHRVTGFPLYQESRVFTESMHRTSQPRSNDQLGGILPELVHIEHNHDTESVLDDLVRLTVGS